MTWISSTCGQRNSEQRIRLNKQKEEKEAHMGSKPKQDDVIEMGFELMYEYVVWLAIGLTVGCRERHYENYLLAD